MRPRLPRSALMAWGVPAFLTLLACAGQPTEERSPVEDGQGLVRVIYVGIDGADWEIVDELVAEGRLPVLARLLDEGSRADLESFHPMLSPLLWTTALTGQPPEVHGICDFTRAVGSERRPVDSTMREAPALWEILGERGQTSAFVNFWASAPAAKVPGILVSDVADALLMRPDRNLPLPAGAVWPRHALDRLAPALLTAATPRRSLLQDSVLEIGPRDLEDVRSFWSARASSGPATDAGSPAAAGIPPLAFLHYVVANGANLERIFASFLPRKELGVVAVYLPEIDQLGHRFQQLAPPRHPLADSQEFGRFQRVIEVAYERLDRFLGKVLPHVDDGSVLLLHSDHGFAWRDDRPQGVLPFSTEAPVSWHRPRGVFLAWGAGVRRGVDLGSVSIFDIAPTILALRGLPPGADMRGQVIARMLLPEVRGRLPAGHVPSWAVVTRRSLNLQEKPTAGESREWLLDELKALGYIGAARHAAEEDPGGTEEHGRSGRNGTCRVNLARWFLHDGRYDEARRAAREIAEAETAAGQAARHLLVDIEIAEGDLDAAVQQIASAHAMARDPWLADRALAVVELRLASDDPAGGARVFELLRPVLARSSALVAFLEGRVRASQGKREAALASFLVSFRADPVRTEAARRYLELAENRMEIQPLLGVLEQAARSTGTSSEHWELLALAERAAGRPWRAVTALRAAAALAPGNPRIARRLQRFEREAGVAGEQPGDRLP